ncbi:MAG TPA: hypothetical protein DCX89_06705 [Saprospirales bacterium]|nr:hypothetical protein [Saprospirales bacterium]
MIQNYVKAKNRLIFAGLFKRHSVNSTLSKQRLERWKESNSCGVFFKSKIQKMPIRNDIAAIIN